jgi:hypothetical protein
MEYLSRLCGLDRVVLTQLSQKDKNYLGISSLFSLLGLVACGLSSFYLFWACTGQLIFSVLGATLVSLIIYAICVVLISGLAIPLFPSPPPPQSQRPRWLRLGIFILISLAFTQPIAVFFLEFSPYAKDIGAKIRQSNAVSVSVTRTTLQTIEGQRQREISRMMETYDRLLASKFDKLTDVKIDTPKTNRKALVIGNQKYPSRPLDNPQKDASDLAAALEKMGFSVKIVLDANRLQMEREIDAYVANLGPKDISVFYFSGHGFHEEGNYLVPIDMKSESRNEAVGLNINLAKIANRHPLINLVIIDACRDFPFGTMKRGGLADVVLGPDTYLALAASPGQSAAEGAPKSNGLFTGALLNNINRNVDIDIVFRSVREEVYRKSGGRQLPWTSSTLGDEFVLKATPSKNQTSIASQSSTAPPIALAFAKFKGLSINPELENLPNSNLCGIVGSPDDSPEIRDQVLLCLGQKILKAQDDLVKLREDMVKFEESQQNNLNKDFWKATRFMSAYSILWSDTLFIIGTLVLTLVLLFILSSGHLMREAFPAAIMNYENLKHQMESARINHEYASYKTRWTIDLNKFLKGPHPHPENVLSTFPFPNTAQEEHEKFQPIAPVNDNLPDAKALLSALGIHKDPKS